MRTSIIVLAVLSLASLCSAAELSDTEKMIVGKWAYSKQPNAGTMEYMVNMTYKETWKTTGIVFIGEWKIDSDGRLQVKTTKAIGKNAEAPEGWRGYEIVEVTADVMRTKMLGGKSVTIHYRVVDPKAKKP